MIVTEKMLVYKAFGLTIMSEIPLPELNGKRDAMNGNEVYVVVSNLSKQWSESEAKQGRFFVGENYVMFQISELATFCIKDGNTIIVSPLKAYDEDKVRLYVLGTCIGVILMQRKVLALHGSAIEISGKAFAFIGDSGAGKSTLASAFIRKGFQLLSDDLIPVIFSKEKVPFVTPSYPQQKLWQESLLKFGDGHLQYRPLFERETKFAIPVHKSFLTEPLPLEGVFELVKTEDDTTNLYPIVGLERFQTLLKQTYRHSLLPRLGLMEWHFNESTQLLKTVKLYRLQRPFNGFTAPELVNHVLNIIKRGELC